MKGFLLFAALFGALIYYTLGIPPKEYPNRLAVIQESNVDNDMYDSVGFSWDVPLLYAMNGARVPYFARHWKGREGGRMLDVGCGGGIATTPLAEMGFQMVGLDYSPRSIERAKKVAFERGLSNIEYVVGSAYELPFENETMDGIVCSDVMEHLTDLPKWASEVWRVLKPGGGMMCCWVLLLFCLFVKKIRSPRLRYNQSRTHLFCHCYSTWAKLTRHPPGGYS